MNIGNQIKALRLKKSVTQEAMAEQSPPGKKSWKCTKQSGTSPRAKQRMLFAGISSD